MIKQNPFQISQTILILLLIITIQSHAKCKKSCNSNSNHSPQDFPYPFGFSASCKIPLNCSQNGSPMIGEFPIQSITSNHIKLMIKAKCNRPFHVIHHFFSRNYAPTAQNAILLQNCSSPISACLLPTTSVETKFESLNCSLENSSISCYSQNALAGDYLGLENLTRNQCGFLLSSISVESLNRSAGVSLEVQTVELGWWLEGNCGSCDGDANCTELISPRNGKLSYRCWCRDGLVGDGYVAGTGCQKASSNCYTMKYIYGECGRTSRIIILIGGIVGGAVVLICLSLFCCFIRRRSKLKAKYITKRRLSEATGKCTIDIYTFKEIEKATANFSEKRKLGVGAYGTVYAGKLRKNDGCVAIKRLKNRDAESIEQVVNEIKLISSINHPNLVKLLGCSIENEEQILVYEFMANETLCQHLHREKDDQDRLSWSVRLDIAVETAQAIAYLHSLNPPIFHRDIKSSNILLDENFTSKVADFGLSRLGMIEISYISTAPQGTPGYLDPQYHQDFHLSDKSDVYSFGVVLVEIITALKVVDFCRPKHEVNLAALAAERIGNGRLKEIIDPMVAGERDEWIVSTVEKVGELAFRCIAFHRDMRPSMVEVAAELEEIRRVRWDQSYSLNMSEKEKEMRKLSMSKKEKEGMKSKKKYMNESESWNSNERGDYFSPVSVQDPWLSEQSSPSSSSLLNNVIL